MSDQEKKVFDQEVNPDEMKAAAGGVPPTPQRQKGKNML